MRLKNGRTLNDCFCSNRSKAPGSEMAKIAAGSSNHVVATNKTGGLFIWENGKWVQVSAELSRVIKSCLTRISHCSQ